MTGYSKISKIRKRKLKAGTENLRKWRRAQQLMKENLNMKSLSVSCETEDKISPGEEESGKSDSESVTVMTVNGDDDVNSEVVKSRCTWETIGTTEEVQNVVNDMMIIVCGEGSDDEESLGNLTNVGKDLGESEVDTNTRVGQTNGEVFNNEDATLSNETTMEDARGVEEQVVTKDCEESVVAEENVGECDGDEGVTSSEDPAKETNSVNRVDVVENCEEEEEEEEQLEEGMEVDDMSESNDREEGSRSEGMKEQEEGVDVEVSMLETAEDEHMEDSADESGNLVIDDHPIDIDEVKENHQEDGGKKRCIDDQEEDGGGQEVVKRRRVSTSYVDSDDENVDDPSPCDSPLLPATAAASDADDECSRKQEDSDSSATAVTGSEQKGTLSIDEESCSSVSSFSRKSKVDGGKSETDEGQNKTLDTLDESIDRVASLKTLPLSFTRSLKGTLNKLTRDELEELCLVKFCEVLTERGQLGSLRRRNQLLEEDMRKWKIKHQVLTKQMKDMDMIMRKYIADVKVQSETNSFQVAKPMRVTRSVGLQVSVSINKNAAGGQTSGGNKKPQVPARVVPPAAQNSKNVVFQQQPHQRPVYGTNVPLARPAIHQYKPASAKPPGPPKLTPKPPQSRPQTDSKLIDLTGDEDRCFGKNNMLVPRQMNFGQDKQSQPLTYVLPTTNSPAGGRQVLITTSAPSSANVSPRPLLPPLIYKGGTFVPQQTQPRQMFVRPQQGVVLGQLRPLVVRHRHPAALPTAPGLQGSKLGWKLMPPRPSLKISRSPSGIVLSWNMNLSPDYEPIDSYQLYAYQETKAVPHSSLWKKVGDVKALPLPMACTLSQFIAGHTYHFAVRAVDIHSRIGPFSAPGNILLAKGNTN